MTESYKMAGIQVRQLLLGLAEVGVHSGILLSSAAFWFVVYNAVLPPLFTEHFASGGSSVGPLFIMAGGMVSILVISWQTSQVVNEVLFHDWRRADQ